MSDDFARIKAALNLREVVTSQTAMAINAAGHLDACPFCQGHDCFSLPKGIDGYKCFQCDASGDVFTFLEKFHNTDRAGALKLGAELANLSLDERKARAPKMSVSDKIRLAAADYYHAHMVANGGKAYFYEKRGHSEAVCAREKVGWTDGHLLDHLRALGFTDRDIIDSGLVKEKEIEGETRTRTSVSPPPPQDGVSTNSTTTPALLVILTFSQWGRYHPSTACSVSCI